MKLIRVEDAPVGSTPFPQPQSDSPDSGCIIQAQGLSVNYPTVDWPTVSWDITNSIGGEFSIGAMSGELVVPEFGTYLWMMRIEWAFMPSLVAGSSESVVAGRSYGGWYCEVYSDGWWADDLQQLTLDPFVTNGTRASILNEHEYSGVVMTSAATKSLFLNGGPQFNKYTSTYVHPAGYSEWSLYATVALVSSLTGDSIAPD